MTSDTHREIFFDSPLNIGQGLATFGALDHTLLDALDTIQDVAGDVDGIDEICTSEAVCTEMGRSDVAMNELITHNHVGESISENQPALDGFLFVTPGHDKLLLNDTPMSSLAGTEKAVQTIISNQSTRDTTRNNDTPADHLTSSEIAMETIGESTYWQDYLNGSNSGTYISMRDMAAAKMLAGTTDSLDANNFESVDGIIDGGEIGTVQGDADGDTVLSESNVGLAKYFADIPGLDHTTVGRLRDLWDNHATTVQGSQSVYQECATYPFAPETVFGTYVWEDMIASPYMQSEVWSNASIGHAMQWSRANSDDGGSHGYDTGPDGNSNQAVKYSIYHGGGDGMDISMDLSNYDTLKFYWHFSSGGDGAAKIDFDDNNQFSGTTQNTWTSSSIDVSSHSYVTVTIHTGSHTNETGTCKFSHWELA